MYLERDKKQRKEKEKRDDSKRKRRNEGDTCEAEDISKAY